MVTSRDIRNAALRRMGIDPIGRTTDPVGRAYSVAKSQYPDTLILVQSGSTYRTFGPDAFTLARTCGLGVVTVTDKRTRENVNTCEIPAHHLDAYLAKVVKRGIRVGIVEEPDLTR